jgi:hypothetical protein
MKRFIAIVVDIIAVLRSTASKKPTMVLIHEEMKRRRESGPTLPTCPRCNGSGWAPYSDFMVMAPCECDLKKLDEAQK